MIDKFVCATLDNNLYPQKTKLMRLQLGFKITGDFVVNVNVGTLV